MSYEPNALDALNNVTLEDEKLKAIVKGAEESLLIISPWHAAQTELQRVITTVVSHCTGYVQAIDASIKMADDGYATSEDALQLCEILLDPITKPETVQGVIEDLQMRAKLAIENCQSTVGVFNTVQKSLDEMTNTIPKSVLSPKNDTGSVDTSETTNTHDRKSEGILKEMKGINLAPLKMVTLSENVDDFGMWWSQMETDLNLAMRKSSELTPEKMKAFRIKAIQKKWTEIRDGYANYKLEIAKLRGFYPEGSVVE